jgi:hypothetical protein
VITPRSLASNWVKEEYYRALSLSTTKQLQLIPILLHDAEFPGFLSGKHYIDFRDDNNYDSKIDSIIWPGITGKWFMGLLAENAHNLFAWNKLENTLLEMGIPASGFQRRMSFQPICDLRDLISKKDNYVRFVLDDITRTALFVDPFNYWPDNQSTRKTSIDLIKSEIQAIFDIRELTINLKNEIVFVLYHHPDAFSNVKTHLDDATTKRLNHYFSLSADFSDGGFKERIREVWNKVQKDFLRTDS